MLWCFCHASIFFLININDLRLYKELRSIKCKSILLLIKSKAYLCNHLSWNVLLVSVQNFSGSHKHLFLKNKDPTHWWLNSRLFHLCLFLSIYMSHDIVKQTAERKKSKRTILYIQNFLHLADSQAFGQNKSHDEK